MYFSFFAILSVLLAYYTVFSAAASADCFRKIGNITTSETSVRVSAGLACAKTEKRNCTIQAFGYANASSTLNISTIHAAEVLDTIGEAFNISFNKVRYESINGSFYPISPGMNGYINFTFSFWCYSGVIAKDCFDDIPVGVPIKACQPQSSTGDMSVPSYLVSSIDLIVTDEATARNMTDNPALAIKPPKDSGANNDTDISPNTSPHSGAVNLLGQGNWPSSLLMMTIVMTITKIGNYFITF